MSSSLSRFVQYHFKWIHKYQKQNKNLAHVFIIRFLIKPPTPFWKNSLKLVYILCITNSNDKILVGIGTMCGCMGFCFQNLELWNCTSLVMLTLSKILWKCNKHQKLWWTWTTFIRVVVKCDRKIFSHLRCTSRSIYEVLWFIKSCRPTNRCNKACHHNQHKLKSCGIISSKFWDLGF